MTKIRPRSWHPIVGSMSDAEVAKIAGVTRKAVEAARKKLGVPSFRAQGGLLRSCSLSDCIAPRYSSGFCEDHYYRWRFYGDPTHLRTRRRSGSTVGLRHKICTVCGQDKLMDLFMVSRQSLDGRTSLCQSCVNLRAALRHRRSKKFVNNLKNAPCLDCGLTFPPVCMDFDHVRGHKRKNVSAMNAFSASVVTNEIAKCDLVCAVCHRVRTKKRVSATTSTRYAQLRQNFLMKLSLIKSSPCLDCKRRYPAEAMDFDHVRGEKLKGVATMWGCSWGKVLTEIAKCDLVCACCHRIRTEARRVPKYPQEGVQYAVV